MGWAVFEIQSVEIRSEQSEVNWRIRLTRFLHLERFAAWLEQRQKERNARDWNKLVAILENEGFTAEPNGFSFEPVRVSQIYDQLDFAKAVFEELEMDIRWACPTSKLEAKITVDYAIEEA